MEYLNDRYVSVYNHKGFDICTLKVAVPANGDEMGYVIDSEMFCDRVFNDVADAIETIDTSYEYKIVAILGNKLEYNGEHDKAISEVKTWLGCEWQCGMIEDMHDYTQLLEKVDIIADKMIKEL